MTTAGCVSDQSIVSEQNIGGNNNWTFGHNCLASKELNYVEKVVLRQLINILRFKTAEIELWKPPRSQVQAAWG